MNILKLDAAVRESLTEKWAVTSRFLSETRNIEIISKMVVTVVHCFQNGGKLIVCGNGGSASDASHFAAEFTGRFKENRRPLPVICLNDSGYLTAVANDFGFADVFSRGVSAFASEGDILVALSTSGNSPNIVGALDMADSLGVVTLLLGGKGGGLSGPRADVALVVDSQDTAVIQEIHMSVLHTIVEVVEKEFM